MIKGKNNTPPVEAEILATKISIIREVYSHIDKKTSLFIDAEKLLEENLEKKNKNELFLKGKEFWFFSIIATFALIIPISLLSFIVSIPLYYGTPIFAILAVYAYRYNYTKKKLPVLNKAINILIETAEKERNSLANIVNQSYYNIKAELSGILEETKDKDFLKELEEKGTPIECKNIIALDYMYHAVSKGYMFPMSEAIKHFRELKSKLEENKEDEKSIELYKEIKDADLRAKYRDCIIARCNSLIPEIEKE